MDRVYLEENRLVGTYGGNDTFMDIWYEEEDGNRTYYKRYWGEEPSGRDEVIDDPKELEKLLDDYSHILHP